MQYLNKCSCDCSDELCKAEVYGEAMQVLQPLNFLTPRLEYFWTLKVKANKFLLAFFGRGAQCKVPDFPAINNTCICFC